MSLSAACCILNTELIEAAGPRFGLSPVRAVTPPDTEDRKPVHRSTSSPRCPVSPGSPASPARAAPVPCWKHARGETPHPLRRQAPFTLEYR